MTYFSPIYESLFGTLNTTEKKIYFFDDSINNKPEKVDDDKPIKFIKIDEGELDCENVKSDIARFDYHSEDSDLKIDFNPNNENSHKENNHTFWERVKCLDDDDDLYGTKEKKHGDNIYLGSGLNSTHFKMINDDIDNISCIVLDWDKTITLIDGITTYDTDFIGNLKSGDAIKKILYTWKNQGHFFRNPDKWGTKQMAEYFLHDPKNPRRIEELSETLIFAQKKGVPIFIVTNNDIPRKNKQIFIDIFDEIGIKINKDCIFGGGSKYKISKEQVIRSIIYDIIDKQAKIQMDAYKSTAMGKKKTKKKQKKQTQTKKKQKKQKKKSKKKRTLRK